MSTTLRELENLYSQETLSAFFDISGLDSDSRDSTSSRLETICQKAENGIGISREEALYLIELDYNSILRLLLSASEIRNKGKGNTLSFSKNVFVPVTRLCRDRCGYCTFKIEPEEGQLLIPPSEVLDIAKKGSQLGCTELLFVTGDKPELKYEVYSQALNELGFSTTAEYLIDLSEKGLKEKIFPHTNLGLSTTEELEQFRLTNPSMGLMLENISDRLLYNGQAHHGCPDKVPKLRMKTMELAGELNIPWTSGILVGIGEIPEESIDSLFALKLLNNEYGHIQEIIIQNFSPKVGIRMENQPSPEFIEMIKLVAISRLIFGEQMNIQVPPNLNLDTYPYFTLAGINDLGGVSPLTIDYVNPEAPWPQLDKMHQMCEENGFELKERLPVYPEFINEKYIDKDLLHIVNSFVDDTGFVAEQEDSNGRN
jgi:FO synthase